MLSHTISIFTICQVKGNTMFKYFITPTSIVVMQNGRRLFIPKTHLYFDKIQQMIKSGCQDIKEIDKEFNLYDKMCRLFPDYVVLDENNHLKLKYGECVDMEKFVYETLRLNDEDKDPIGFLMMLGKANASTLMTVKEMVNFIKEKGYTVSPAGDIVCYAHLYDDKRKAVLANAEKGDAIITVNPAKIIYDDHYRASEFSIIYEATEENEKLPKLEDTVVFGGDDLLMCF